ncbi:succinylglutamate desuccinylase/aspartoacylase family protein [Paenibacillus sp. GYB003]|uniref:succinylglutamate desuccinylase/aspartoacylase family protein n=1 Tax=Paenibacillus sp. GYB003 TaxID=2994392 RepID=UPI002F963534
MAVRMSIDRFDAKSAARGTKQSFELTVDYGFDGSNRDEPGPVLPALLIAGAHEGRTLLVLAGVHGDEYEGMDAILRLYRDIRPETLAGTLVMAPAANPLACRGGTRHSPEDGLNMARVFPGERLGRPTERLAWQLHHRFIARADFLLDLHSGGANYAVSTLVGYCHDDGTDVGRRSRAAAESFGAELLWAHESVAPGRTVSSATALGVPWLYTEAYGGRRVRGQDAELFYNGARNVMRHLGMLPDRGEPGSAREPAPARRIYGDGNFDGSETAGASGFFVPQTELGAAIRAGEPVGAIYGFDGEERQRVLASRDGVVVMLPGTPAVRAGEPLFLIAPTEPCGSHSDDGL